MRCKWVNLDNPLYVNYHDNEWGVASYDDRYLFAMLILELFQAGLSWECILNKRENFRLAFDNFDYDKVALYDDKKVSELMNNPAIIRNKLKIHAAINNAKVFKQIKEEYKTFSNYIWSFTKGKVIKNMDDNFKPNSELSSLISNDLKRRKMKLSEIS